jgi:UPF0176 protein
VYVATFYRFAALTGIPALRDALQARATDLGLRGTILLAREGVNGTIGGPEHAVTALLAWLREVPGLAALSATCSVAPGPVFARLKVKVRRELVSLGQEEIRPYLESATGTPVPPSQWDGLIGDPTTLVIDTRNAYEVAIGSFAGAIDPATASFRDFPAWVEQTLRPLVAKCQPRALALFCTGGIRCEKATAHLLKEGFSGVHQLQGGILRYLAERPAEQSRWQGECFVFDQRVALRPGLTPGDHRLCPACGWPLARGAGPCPHCSDRSPAHG